MISGAPTIEYETRARVHAPQTPEEVARAARDLIAGGFTDSTAAAVLHLDVNALRQLLGPRNAG